MSERYFIKLCFLDGERDGAVRCQDGEERYIAYRFSRARYDGICREKKKDELLSFVANKGIYFLLFRDNNEKLSRVYVGKAGDRSNERLGMLNRINEHGRKNDHYRDWDEAVLLTTKDNDWGPTELNYLENGFYKILQENGTHPCCNGNTPTGAKPTEDRKHYLDKFLAKTSRDLVGAMGIVFLDLPKKKIKKTPISHDEAELSTPGLKKASFNFSTLGIRIGEELTFTECPITVKVADEKNKISYKGKTYSLSGFVKAFHPHPNNSGAYQGPKYFTYKGNILADLRSAAPAAAGSEVV